MTCRFVLKKTQEPCSNKEILPFGFCKKHSNTLQGKQAKEEWLNQQEKEKQQENVKQKKGNNDESRKIIIRKNSYGRFEEPKSHIVFDPTSQKAYGVQGKGGELLPLTEKHIKICERYGWKVLTADPYLSEESD